MKEQTRENLTLTITSVKPCGLDFLRDVETVNLDKLGSRMRDRDAKRLDLDN